MLINWIPSLLRGVSRFRPQSHHGVAVKRHAKVVRIGQVEGLEDRALLSGISPVALPDNYLVSQDTPRTVTAASGVLQNDVDAESDTLTATLNVGPTNGTVTLDPNGSFLYTPNANFVGTDTFTYTANDGTSNSLPTVVTLTISATNLPPVAVTDAYTVTTNTVRTVTAANGVLVNDTDPEGAPLTAVLDVGPTNGAVTLSPDGSFVYTPNANYVGADSFTYHANDGTNDSAPTVVTLTVSAINAPPVANADAYSVTTGTAATITAANGLLANDVDAEGNPLTAVLDTNPTNGTLVLNPDGSFVYTPNANFTGADSFIYHANDGTSDSVPAIVTLTVTAVNVPPVAVADAYTVTTGTVRNVNAANGVLANDTDVESDPLTAVLDVGPTNGTLTLNPNGSFVYTPNANFVGADSFSYHANDGTSDSAPTIVTLTVSAINTPPVAVADAYSVTTNTIRTVTAANGVLINDTDAEGSPLTAVLDVGPTNGTLTLNPDGSFVYTPNANYSGADSFSYHANDGTSDSIPTVVTLTVSAVNGAPVALPDAYTVTTNTVRNVNAATGVLANDIDPEDNPLTAILDIGPTNGTLTLNTDGSFIYTPNLNYTGPDSFTYHANDGTSNSIPTTVTLTVSATNAPPVANADAYAVEAGTVETVNAATGVLANDIDAEGNPLTAVLDVGPTNGTLVLNSDGSFVYTPNANYTGVDSFIYHANDGTSDSIPTVVTLTVAAANAAPVAVADAYTVTTNTVRNVNAATGVLANDIDADGDTLSAILDVGPTNGTFTLNPDGSFVYTPNANYTGADSFTYHANDGTNSSLPTVVTLTVAAVNTPPVAVADAYAVDSNTAETVNAAQGVLANDTDLEGNSLTAVLEVGPANGTLVLNADGSFVYTPNANFTGVDTFTYHANDGTSDSSIATVTLTVTELNVPPVGVPDTYLATESTALTVNTANGVLSNDTDLNGDTLTAVLQTGPTNGTLTLNSDGSFVYTPNANFSGTDTFTYIANDGTADSTTTLVTITVDQVNVVPVAVNDLYFVDQNGSLNVGAGTGVLSNDVDLDGDTLNAVLVTLPQNGSVVLNANGSFTYTPDVGFSGVDTFSYLANDGTGNSNTATVTLTVDAVATPPVIVTSQGSTTTPGRRVILDPAVDLIDADSPNFSGGHLDVVIQSGAGRRDQLSYKRGGANRGAVNMRRNELRVGKTVIGTISGGKRGTPLRIDFNSNASQELVEQAMQALTFRGTRSQPGTRVVSLQITDNTNLQSNLATKNVEVG